MTDDSDTDTADDATAVPPAQPDAFAALSQLLYLIGNTAFFEARLKELRKLERETARARIELVSEQAKHAEAVAKDRAEVVALGEAARKREVAAVTAEEKLAEWKEKIVAFQYSQRGERDSRRYEPLPGGGARDWGEGGRWRDDAPRPLDDPVYDQPRSAAIADETELEHVAPTASTLTRSVPRPRKSMKRVQPNV
jgi:hypothetical protein